MIATVPGNVHLDQAVDRATEVLRELIDRGVIARAVLVNDLFGRIRVAVWPAPDQPEIRQILEAQLSEAWGPIS